MRGSGRMKVDDEIVELKEWDAVRVPPGTWRGYEAGPEELEILVIGAPNLGEDPRGDVDGRRGWWADSPLADLLRQADEDPLGAADVTEPILILVLHQFTDQLGSVRTEPGERIVDVVHGEHDTQITQSVHRGVPVIGDHRRREKSRELDSAVTVRRTHHGDLDALVAQPGDTP